VTIDTASPQAPHSSRVLSVAVRLREANMFMVLILAFFIGLVAGGILISFTTPDVTSSWSHFFSHPGYTVGLTWDTVANAYSQLFQGALVNFHDTHQMFQNPNKANVAQFLTPIASSLTYATPLIVAGLGLAIGFRSGLFDIGGQGQILAGGLAATWAGFTFHFTPVVQVAFEILVAVIVGGLLAGFAGLLKAYTGAHEVIVTMMTNYIMKLVMGYLLIQPLFALGLIHDGQSKSILPNGQLPQFLDHLSPTLALNFGFVIAVLAVVAVQWFFNRSKTGFELLMVGQNSEAARTAGINVKRATIITLSLAGSFLGLAGMLQVAGVTHYIDPTFGGTYGFDAITVALLGRNKPWGVFFGALFFGFMYSGGHIMQASTNIAFSLALVIQAVVVFCVATPAVVIELFRLRDTGKFAITGGAK